jgi:cytochrome c peroxidase
VGARAQNDDPYYETARVLFQPLPEPVARDGGPLDPEQVELGWLLFHDPRLSLSGFVSCNSCHNLASYGVDALPTSVGHRWSIGPRNAPTVFNAALHAKQFWDGRALDVEEQAGGPVLNPIEMAIPDEAFALERLASIPEYVDRFAAAFGDDPEPLSYANMATAIGAFERTLITRDRFDAYLEGDPAALNDAERSGLRVFIENGCTGCHGGAALGGTVFARFGIVEAYWEATRPYVTIDTPTMPMDVGVYAVTQDPDDLYVFKSPSLRNITRTYPYFHDGSVWDLGDALQVMARVQLGDTFSEQELSDLLAFFGALEGTIPEEALRLPVLPASTGGTLRPSNR